MRERRRREGQILEILSRWTSGRDADSAVAALAGAGVPAGAARDFQGLHDDARLAARGFFEDVEAPDGRTVRLPTLPWRPGVGIVSGRAPNPGEHSAEVLSAPGPDLLRRRAATGGQENSP